MIERAANSVLWMSVDPTTLPPQVGPPSLKRCLGRQKDLSEAKRKPIAATRKKPRDPEFVNEVFLETSIPLIDKSSL